MKSPKHLPQKEWYQSYFSEPYGTVYADYILPPELTRMELQLVRKALKLAPSDMILDCPCGYGRHMEKLLPRHPNLVGMDLDYDCLHRAASRIASAPLVRGDMRDLPFASERFDAILNLFNSFGYFGPEENLRVLRELARVLKPKGRLLIDISNPSPLVEVVKDFPRTQQQVGNLVLTEDWAFDPAARMLSNHTRIELGGQTVERSYRVQLYTLVELQSLLSQAGLSIRKAYGETEATPFDEETSTRLIVVASRE
jgi:SAM-dependent methyltransferase